MKKIWKLSSPSIVLLSLNCQRLKRSFNQTTITKVGSSILSSMTLTMRTNTNLLKSSRRSSTVNRLASIKVSLDNRCNISTLVLMDSEKSWKRSLGNWMASHSTPKNFRTYSMKGTKPLSSGRLRGNSGPRHGSLLTPMTLLPILTKMRILHSLRESPNYFTQTMSLLLLNKIRRQMSRLTTFQIQLKEVFSPILTLQTRTNHWIMAEISSASFTLISW